VLWIGVDEGAARLCELAERLSARLAARGYASEERPFVPHLTIARTRRPRPLTAAIEALRELRASGRIQAIELVRSRLGGKEAGHEVLLRFELRG
jgi:2'-5' RNA ligase